jgi:hypothetical protein
MRFHNNHRIIADDAARFLEDHFQETWIFVTSSGQLRRSPRGLNGSQPNDAAFRLGNNFLRNDQNVVLLQRNSPFASGLNNESCDIVAFTNFRKSD